MTFKSLCDPDPKIFSLLTSLQLYWAGLHTLTSEALHILFPLPWGVPPADIYRTCFISSSISTEITPLSKAYPVWTIILDPLSHFSAPFPASLFSTVPVTIWYSINYNYLFIVYPPPKYKLWKTGFFLHCCIPRSWTVPGPEKPLKYLWNEWVSGHLGWTKLRLELETQILRPTHKLSVLFGSVADSKKNNFHSSHFSKSLSGRKDNKAMS